MKNRNPSNKTPLELSRVFYREILVDGVTAETLFNVDITIETIIHLPHMAGHSPCDDLVEMVEDGEIDKLVGREIQRVSQLADVTGFIVEGHVQIWNFSHTTFDADGCIDSADSDIGRYIVFGFGPDLDSAYRAMVEVAVQRQAGQIERGLAAPTSTKSHAKSN